jgi:hypothetical protein
MRGTPSKQLPLAILFVLFAAMDNWSRTLRLTVICLATAISIAIIGASTCVFLTNLGASIRSCSGFANLP